MIKQYMVDVIDVNGRVHTTAIEREKDKDAVVNEVLGIVSEEEYMSIENSYIKTKYIVSIHIRD
ncbi:hypothetical protein [Staphylococcus saprophyticus]|uniref:hypothetical protein n=1 Tax=Staphylococcus saprophyticus TaxID=29385 RepID=UPI0009907031|nr:hypothetical protein [Staphylococcus saprophyticus]OOO72386.1 hypothetical protein B0W56_00420 [Staphylococcus saprophyticus]